VNAINLLLSPAAIAGAVMLTAIALLRPIEAVGQSPATPKILAKEVGLDQRLGEQVPLDVTLIDEQGQAVALKDLLRDRPVILSLVYFRCPMLCTQVLNGVLKSSQGLTLDMGTDYDILSVSIDPKDTPEGAAKKKETYVAKYRRAGAEEGWRFLTGRPDEVARLAAAVGYRYRYDPKTDQYAHPSGVILLTPEGQISRYFYGIDYSPRDLRLGLIESSDGKIGTPVDQILLLCFHYDPATGKYGLVISRVLQTAGTATALALGAFLWTMFRLERRRSRAVAREVHDESQALEPAPLP
jgi:protein SCO1